jgi:mannitol-1-phosphate/altronate dehydrogenase
MTTERLSKIEGDLESLTTIVAATARYAESAQESFTRLNDRIDEYIYQSQRIIGGHEERIISAQGSAERLEAVFAMQQRQMERLEQNQNAIQQNQGLLQQLVVTQQAQLNRMDETQRSTNAALEQLGSILNQLLKNPGGS